MKSLLYSRTKILGVFLGVLVLAFSYGCQKDLIETDNASDPVSDEVTLKGAKIEDLMVITTSETLPAGFEKVQRLDECFFQPVIIGKKKE